MTVAKSAEAEQTRPRRKVLLSQLAPPLRRLLEIETGSAGLLLAATIFALVWANSPLSDSYESLWSTELVIAIGDHSLAMDLRHWINDGLMAIFFFLVGLEVRREISVGELKELRGLTIPVIAAVGGLLIPAALYLAVNPSGDAASGWGVVIGTDTAFLLGALTLVGPSISTQLRVFLLTMSVADDVLAVGVIGVVYSESVDAIALAIAVSCIGMLALFGRLGVWRTSVYGLVGLVLWVATVESGLHPAIAGMLAGLVIAAYPPQRDLVDRAASLFRAFQPSPLPRVGTSANIGLQRAVSVNERLQEVWRPWTSFVIVPVFALANAGVDLRGWASR